MKNIAFVPLRAGSKGIPNKNIMPIAGKPLCFWVIEALLHPKCKIDQVVVSTDSTEYVDLISSNYKHLPKLRFANRSPEVSTDTATTEEVVVEYLSQHPHLDAMDRILLVQATTPTLTYRDVNGIIAMRLSESIRSVLSVVDIKHRVLWTDDVNRGQFVRGTRYHQEVRRPRQHGEKPILFMENGAMYLNTVRNWVTNQNRFTPTIGFFEMGVESMIEVDSWEDWYAVEALLSNKQEESW